MKNKFKIITFMVMGILIFSGCKDKKESINVFNFGDYIDESILKIFENETGIKVKYDTFATNEDMYVRLKQGGDSYDVVFISDYMIERSIKENYLEKINWDNIPNEKYINPIFRNLVFDPQNEYSAPFTWGTMGIIYNETYIKDDISSWNDLWNEKYSGEILMLNSQRDTLGVALIKLGYSMNTRNEEELEKAKKILIKQKPIVYAYLGDDIKDALISGEGSIGVVWSGDAVYMREENPHLKYIVPREGTNLWFDSMVIPKSTKNKKGAEKFINFLLRPDISKLNSEYNGYSSPIPEAVKLLDKEIQNDPVSYPSKNIIDKAEIFRDPSDILYKYDQIWTEIISSN